MYLSFGIPLIRILKEEIYYETNFKNNKTKTQILYGTVLFLISNIQIHSKCSRKDISKNEI